MPFSRRFAIGSLLVIACSPTPEPVEGIAQACARDADFGCARPIFNVANLRRSRDYYRDKLGFRLDWEHGDPPDFASVSRGETTLFLCEGCQGYPGAWVMTFVDDVDRVHARLRARGAMIRMPPKDMPWGVREVHVQDPDANVLRIGGPVRR